MEFHERVREMFLQLATGQPEHYLVLDGRKPVQEISAEIWARLEPLLDGATRNARATAPGPASALVDDGSET